MKYALAISALTEQFTASYVSIYSFKKYHPNASVLFFGDRPDTILANLDVFPVTLDLKNLPITTKHPNKLYTNNLAISLRERFDAFVVADYDILFNNSLEDLVTYAIQTRHVIGSTNIVNNRLVMNKSVYIVPSNSINNKIRGTIFQGVVKDSIEPVLIDAYYPILIDVLNEETCTVYPGTSLIHTPKRIVHYADGAWRNTPENDLWTKMGEELIDNLGR